MCTRVKESRTFIKFKFYIDETHFSSNRELWSIKLVTDRVAGVRNDQKTTRLYKHFDFLML